MIARRYHKDHFAWNDLHFFQHQFIMYALEIIGQISSKQRHTQITILFQLFLDARHRINISFLQAHFSNFPPISDNQDIQAILHER